MHLSSPSNKQLTKQKKGSTLGAIFLWSIDSTPNKKKPNLGLCLKPSLCLGCNKVFSQWCLTASQATVTIVERLGLKGHSARSYTIGPTNTKALGAQIRGNNSPDKKAMEDLTRWNFWKIALVLVVVFVDLG